MLGVLRNGLRLSNKPLSLLPSSQGLYRNSNDGLASKSACQQCNVDTNLGTITPSWLQVPARFFGTLRTLVSSSSWRGVNDGELLTRSGPFPDVIGSENSIMTTIGGPYYLQSRGMKYKGKVKRRCKDCYLMWINGMLYNLCRTHPRHKHGLKPAYFVNQRVLTHATMSPKRPW